MPRPLLAALACLSLLGVGGCGANEAGPGTVVLRYEPAVGATIRYHTILRRVPGDAPGRTVSAEQAITPTGRTDDGATSLRVTHPSIHIAGEGDSGVDVRGELQIGLRVDPRQSPLAPATVSDETIAASADLARFLGEALVLPEGAVGLEDTWTAPPLTRELLDAEVTVSRSARVTAVEGGVATIEVTGQPTAPGFTRAGVTIEIGGELTERHRIRVADGQLVERDQTLELRVRALRGGRPFGELSHHERAHTERITGAAPSPALHDWRPDRHDRSCDARLSAMRRRSTQAPRGVDLSSIAAVQTPWPQAPDGRAVDETGPVLHGLDAASMAAAIEGADLRRAVVAYVLAPESVDDGELAEWSSALPSFIERRRLVLRPVDPPSPPRPAAVEQVATAMRARGEAAWSEAMAGAIVTCGAAREAMASADERPAPERPEALRAGVQDALDRCGCASTDLVLLEHLLDLRHGGPDVSWVPLRR